MHACMHGWMDTWMNAWREGRNKQTNEVTKEESNVMASGLGRYLLGTFMGISEPPSLLGQTLPVTGARFLLHHGFLGPLHTWILTIGTSLAPSWKKSKAIQGHVYLYAAHIWPMENVYYLLGH